MEGLGGGREGWVYFSFLNYRHYEIFYKMFNMINDHIILQSHLIYFRKTCYIVRNLKTKSKPSPPFHHSFRTFRPTMRLILDRRVAQDFIPWFLASQCEISHIRPSSIIHVAKSCYPSC